MISIIVLTYNDQVNIRATLESISDFSNDIIIIDSYSTDNTKSICDEYGCRFYQNKFINQAIQFNWVLDNVRIKYNWILRLDSDEVLTNALKKEILFEIKNNKKNFSGFYINRKMIWMGKWLKYGRMYPHFILRLFMKGKGRYEEKTEEHIILEGKSKYLKENFYEDNKKNNLRYFTEKHLSTAEGEVDEILLNSNSYNEIESSFFGKKIERTRWLKKNIYNKFPLGFRALFYFIYRYVFCLGFLDGKPGLIWHVLQAFWYRFYIDSLLHEKKIKNKK